MSIRNEQLDRISAALAAIRTARRGRDARYDGASPDVRRATGTLSAVLRNTTSEERQAWAARENTRMFGPQRDRSSRGGRSR
jgi:hypothetical protein